MYQGSCAWEWVHIQEHEEWAHTRGWAHAQRWAHTQEWAHTQGGLMHTSLSLGLVGVNLLKQLLQFLARENTISKEGLKLLQRERAII